MVDGRQTRARTAPPPVRAAGVALVAATASGAGLALAAAPLEETRDAMGAGTAWRALPLDLLLSSACAAALALCSVWLLAVTLAAVLEALTGASSRALHAITPRLVRRGVLLACGLAIGSTTVAAPAAAGTDAGPGAGGVEAARAVLDLDGLPLPDRPAGPLRVDDGHEPRTALTRATPADPGPSPDLRAATLRPAPERTALTSARAGTATVSADDAAVAERHPLRYEVRRGDSLWSIARRLRPGSDPAGTDRTWRRIYRENRPAIGSDPNLLIPGTTLHLPVRPSGADRLDGLTGPGSPSHRKDAS